MKQNIIVFYARSVLYMLVFVAALLISFIILAYGGKIMDLISGFFPQLTSLNGLFDFLRYARYILVTLILYLAFLMLYRFIPMKKVKLRDQHAGAVFSSLAWVLFSFIFSFYTSHSNKFGAYGMIGTVMVAMLWLYYCLYIFFFGAEINEWLVNPDSFPF